VEWKLYLVPVRTVSVQLGNRSYAIKIGEGLLAQLGGECARLKLGNHCAIITDTNVGRRFAKPVYESGQGGIEPVLITVSAGETAKSLKSIESCYDQIAAHRLERKSFIIALGGGVVGDLADLSQRLICVAFRLCKCRRRCWRRWTVLLAARRRELEGGKISSERFISRDLCCAIWTR